MSAENKESVILQTSDEEQFTVERKVAERSAMIKSMLEGESSFWKWPEHRRKAIMTGKSNDYTVMGCTDDVPLPVQSSNARPPHSFTIKPLSLVRDVPVRSSPYPSLE
jgi:hypothetical protein